jgi:hypothetical protein
VLWREDAPSETLIVGAQGNRRSAPSEAGGRGAWTVERHLLFFPGEPFVVEQGKREGLAEPIDIVPEVMLDVSLQDGLPGCGAESLG